MRRIIVALLALAMLLPSALAMGNVITQTNSQTASGAGVGTITQTGANYGITVGSGNTLTQENVANAKLTAKVGAIANADLIGLVTSSAWRQNDGYYYKEGEHSATASANWAEESFALIDGVSINQDQKNIAIQLGCMNTMNQKNDANAIINAIAYADAYAYAEVYAEADAFAYGECWICDGSSGEFATQASSSADIYGSSEAFANAEVLDVTINQVQENLGVQVGAMNSMDQSNDADATIDVVVDLDARATADADAIADIGLYAYSAPYPDWTHAYVNNVNARASAGAYASTSAAVRDISIEQDQKNIGVQLGAMNKMAQSNDADGVIEAEFIYGVGAGASAFDADVVDYYVYGGYGGYSATGSASASAYASAGAAETVENLHKVQTQSNIGVEVGFGNGLVQSNIAADPMTGSNNVVNQTSENVAIIVGCMNTANQLNDLYADSDDAFYDDEDVINQVADNIAIMVGCCGDIDQTNDLDAVQASYSSVPIDQTNIDNIGITVGL